MKDEPDPSSRETLRRYPVTPLTVTGEDGDTLNSMLASWCFVMRESSRGETRITTRTFGWLQHNHTSNNASVVKGRERDRSDSPDRASGNGVFASEPYSQDREFIPDGRK